MKLTEGKSWLIAIGITCLLMLGIFYLVVAHHESQMRRFGQAYQLELLASEHRSWHTGPFLVGRNLQVYRAVYHSKVGPERVFWFMFGGFKPYVYEEVAAQKYQPVNFPLN